jgi:uncharacterized membrane protein required for colicin V production
MQRAEIIPLTENEIIKKEFGVGIVTPPPHRSKLGVSTLALKWTLETLRIVGHPVAISFYPITPKVSTTPKATEVTAPSDVPTRRPDSVVVDDGRTGSPTIININIGYKNSETDTPENTAINMSKKLRDCMGKIPARLYRRNIADIYSVEFLEFINCLQNAVTAVIGGGLSTYFAYVTDKVTGSAPSSPDILRFTVVTQFVYLMSGVLDLAQKSLYLKSKLPFKRYIGQTLRERPARAFIPISTIENYVFPSIKYRLNAKSHGDILRTL